MVRAPHVDAAGKMQEHLIKESHQGNKEKIQRRRMKKSCGLATLDCQVAFGIVRELAPVFC